MLQLLEQFGEVEQKTKNTFVVRVSQNRTETLNKIAEQLGGIYDSTPSSISSVGFVKIDRYRVLVKPIDKQGYFSSGKQNELFFLDKLNKIGYFDTLIFHTPSKRLVIEQYLGAQDVSCKKDKNFKHKADVQVDTQSTAFLLSLKMSSAEYWESSDSYAGPLVKTYVDYFVSQNKVTLSDYNGVKKIEPNIAIECSLAEANNVVFGDDLGENGYVIIRNFVEEDFFLMDNILYVKCDQIISDINDLEDYQKPYFLIRNDSTRNCGYKGVRVLSCYKQRVKDHLVVVNLEERSEIEV